MPLDTWRTLKHNKTAALTIWLLAELYYLQHRIQTHTASFTQSLRPDLMFANGLLCMLYLALLDPPKHPMIIPVVMGASAATLVLILAGFDILFALKHR